MSSARIGLDIGGTKTHAVVLDGDLTVLGEARLPTGVGAEAVIASALATAHGALADAGLELSAIELIGVGIPGAVDHRTGEVTQALNLELEHLALGSLLTRSLGRAVHVENDVNAAALGAAAILAAPGGSATTPAPVAVSTPSSARPSLAYLNLGTGVAAGLVLDGELWRGSRGAAGEIGHLPIDPLGPPCRCGLRGCLETMASGSGLADQWGPNPPPANELVRLAASGEPHAKALTERLMWAVASAVRVLALSHDVTSIVIGGGLSRLEDDLLVPVVDQLRRWESASPFLAALQPSSRLAIVPSWTPVAAIGAALAGSTTWAPAHQDEGEASRG